MTIEDPVARLSAVLAEDEQIARAAFLTTMEGSDRWMFEAMQVWTTPPPGWQPPTLVVQHTWPNEGQHIARHDPARALLEVALKRLILEQHSGVIIDGPDHWVTVPVCRECTKWGRQVHDYVPWPCEYIQALQAIYPDTTETEGAS